MDVERGMIEWKAFYQMQAPEEASAPSGIPNSDSLE